MDAKCSVCGARAERRFTEVVGGQRRSMPLCLACARSHEPGPAPLATPAPPKLKVKLHAQLIGQGLPPSTLRCSGCGMGVVDLRKTGRLGCPQCYQVFRKQIAPLLERIHGATEHEGRRPVRPQASRSLGALREELRLAIEAEDFEQAARLRDRIGARGESRPESGEDHE